MSRKLDAADEGMPGVGGAMGGGKRGGRTLAQLDAEARARSRSAGGVAASAASGMADAVGRKRTRAEAASSLDLGGFGAGSDGSGWDDDEGGAGGGRGGGGGGGGGRRGGGDEEEGEDDPLYAAMAEAAARKKARKAATREAEAAATADYVRSRADKYAMAAGDDDGGDAHRKVGRDIMKNRGLTKYRKREERNPRVHNRMKADKFVKRRKGQVAPLRDVAKEGGYGGEATGIRTNVTHSTKIR